MTLCYIGLGSNLGDRAAMLRSAVDAFEQQGVHITARSSVYETDPVGGPGEQPSYLNQVVAAETTLDPQDLLERCLEIEKSLGRAREIRWGPRTIDVDVLLCGDAIVSTERCVVPHPRLHERAFMLVPLVEIAPGAQIPGHGRARACLRALSSAGVRLYAARS